MANVFDVADFILDDLGSSSTMKLQKIVFYSHAYHLVRFHEPLLDCRIEAWANGPVVPVLFDKHRHSFVVSQGCFSPYSKKERLASREKLSIRAALKTFRDMTGSELSDLTHSEAPWKNARQGLDPAARSNNLISDESIRRFYSSAKCENPLFVGL